MKTPRIGVVIVHWNCPALLQRCLEHIRTQTFAPTRVVVVDNASTGFDADAWPRRFPGVTVVTLPENLGFAGGANHGAIELADCDWLAFLNPDAFPEPGWLQALALAIERHPGTASFASCVMKQEPPNQMDGTGDIVHLSGRVWRRDEGCPIAHAPDCDQEVFSACAAAALYDAALFQKLGGFEERYFCYLEDVDLGFRLRLLGHRCVFVANARVRHIGSAVTVRNSDFSIYHGHRNLVWTFIRNMPPALFWVLLPYHLLLNLATLANFAPRGHARVIGRAKRDALRGLPRVWQERRRIQKMRTAKTGAIWRSLHKGLPWPRCR